MVLNKLILAVELVARVLWVSGGILILVEWVLALTVEVVVETMVSLVVELIITLWLLLLVAISSEEDIIGTVEVISGELITVELVLSIKLVELPIEL